MTHTVATERAEANFERQIKHNPYPGRGLVVGRAADGASWLMIYWIMGRSAQSRNRSFVAEDTCLRTEPVDPSLVDDPSLIIYEAMLEAPPLYVVGNGDQVRTLYDALQADISFDDALAGCEREPDAPHYTPRISAMLDLDTFIGQLTLSILKANAADPAHTDRITYRPAPPPAGFGMGLTTYLGDANPLPSFQGDPLLLPCQGTVEEVLQTYWQALDADNRIAIAVKQIPADGGTGALAIYNRYA
jgi:IMP cyclohydrolase